MDDDEEDFIFFGTPMPEIEDEATLKKKAAKELQVRDEKGRQRFHGAFTGGFSAGYFNTVGTKEGWAPSSFMSSRGKAADRIQQNPEDFMDEEDFGEFGIATRKIHTTANFQDVPSKSSDKRKFIDSDSVIPGDAPLKDIVQPVGESIGILILRKLGWREGQGIGPRVKKADARVKVYGCLLFPDAGVTEEEDTTASMFTFAPADTESMSFKPKDNCFGLGYTGLSKQSVLSVSADPFAPTSTKSWLAKEKKKIKISGQAFGVGTFEDDDEDIYGKDDMSQYDFSELEVKKSTDSAKAIETSKYGNSHEVLEGFHLATQPPLVKKQYPPPTLPPNFKPIHSKIIRSAPPITSLDQFRQSLTASDRSLLLGERNFQKVSLNDPVKQKRTSRFETVQPEPSSSTLKSRFESVQQEPSSTLKSHFEPEQPIPLPTSQSRFESVQPAPSSSKFCPFSSDLAKKQRYDEYLKLKQTGDISKFVQPSSMTEWERQQEREEFSKAAILFRPLSSALSSYFESKSNLSAEHEVQAALEKYKKDREKKSVVKRNLVGKSNRKTIEWHPVSLLCKRMNVPNPYPNSNSSGTQNVFKSKSVFDHLASDPGKSQNSRFLAPTTSEVLPETANDHKDEPNEIPKQVAESVDAEKMDLNTVNVPVTENKRPPMDFFKDIFENSSSDEDDADEKTEKQDEIVSEKTPSEVKDVHDDISPYNSSHKETTNAHNKDNDVISSTIQNSSPVGSKKVGFGVFANLDLDALNQRRPIEKPSQMLVPPSNNGVKEDTLSSKSSINGSKSKQLDDVYGPELPPNFKDSPVPAIASSSSSLKKHSKSKSKHKHKHHKHKHKKKKKKSKKDTSSSDSSEEDMDDIPPSLIIEKIKELQRKKS